VDSREILLLAYTQIVQWTVEYTDQFEEWWNALDAEAQEDIDVVVRVLESIGPALTRPYADTVKNSRHPNMRELRGPEPKVGLSGSCTLSTHIALRFCSSGATRPDSRMNGFMTHTFRSPIDCTMNT
jgi:hypothetical protein